MALYSAGIELELREVRLSDKPQSMLIASQKGTVPVLQVNELVVDESLDVMRWALNQNDAGRLDVKTLEHPLIAANDGSFKYDLDRYKYFDRYPQHSQNHYFERALNFVSKLGQHIAEGSGMFIAGVHPKAVDIAIFPFIRQFAMVDRAAFNSAAPEQVQQWLEYWLESGLFASVMDKHAIWDDAHHGVQAEPGQPEPGQPEPGQPKVEHVVAEQQFLIRIDYGAPAVLQYTKVNDNEVDFHTTRVPTSQRRQGLAGLLVDAAFIWAKQQGLVVKTSCWYAAKHLKGRIG